jgi:hypothetical protein
VAGLAATREVRVHIRLKPEAAEVWSKLSRTERVKLGALVNKLIALYGRTGRAPVILAAEEPDILKLQLLTVTPTPHP